MEERLALHLKAPRPGSEEYRRALVKRDAIRNAVVAPMDEHRLGAVVYPSMRRKPARIGEPQPGTNCQLSASSGLPATHSRDTQVRVGQAFTEASRTCGAWAQSLFEQCNHRIAKPGDVALSRETKS